MSKILLVEDDTMISSGITYALELEGYEVVCGRNKNEALANLLNLFEIRSCDDFKTLA